MLRIWTAADAANIKKTFGKSLKAMAPDIPKHDFIVWDDSNPHPVPGLGEVILVCGEKPLNQLRQAGIVHKGRKVSSMREQPVKHGEGYYLVTYDPGVLANQPELSEIIDWDVRLAKRLMVTGATTPVVGQYKWVNSYAPMIEWIKFQYSIQKQPIPVSMDTETQTFYPWYEDRDIVSISFTAQPGTAEVLYLGDMPHPIALDPDTDLFEQVEWLLTNPMVKLQVGNGKYDLVWIWEKWKIRCTNFKFDPILAASLLNENRSNSLNTLCKIKTDIGGYDDAFNAKYDKSKMGEIPAGDDLLTYAGGDTDGLQRAAEVIRTELLEDGELANFYVHILHPASRAFERIESRGVLVDQQYFANLSSELAQTIKLGTEKSLSLLPNKMLIKHRDRIDEQIADGKNPMLPSILKEFFFTTYGLNLKPKVTTPKTGEPSMAKSHLKMFSDHPAAKAMVEALTDVDTAAKTKSTFVDGFIKHIRPDGRLHPIYMLFHGSLNDDADDDDSGTTTGRLSAKEPAIQITPKKTKFAKKIRKGFPAPPGKAILALDYSQGELKVVACIANEQSMIAAYKDGLDLHAVTGSTLGQVSYEEFVSWKEHQDETKKKMYNDFRDRAKAGNFGLLYGMGVEGFQAYAWANYGVKLSYDDAAEIRTKFFQLYPGLLGYHDDMRTYVKLHEMVRSPLGRVRHLPHIKSWAQEIRAQAERRAINAPVQSTLTDMMIWAIALIEDAYPNDEIAIFAMIHDAIYAYVDADKVELRAKQAIEIMSNLPFQVFDWQPQLQFTADAESGLNLAELSKIKLAA